MTAGFSSITAEQKRAALDAVLKSHAFARSDQLRSFLKFICEKEISGQGNEINEYLIGIEVMHRSASYSPNEDGAVRNRAYALRNKLQEFYAQEKPPAEIRIELPKGSYCPHFIESRLPTASVERPEPAVVPWPASRMLENETPPAKSFWIRTRMSKRRWWIAAFACCLLFSMFLVSRLAVRKSALDEFWEPVRASRNPVLICTTQPVVYQLTGQAREKVLRQSDASLSHELPPDELLQGRDVAAISDQYIGIGTAHAAAQLTALFTRWNKPSRIKIGNEASFSDLRHSPTVSVGAFGNRWTMSIANKLRFVFEEKSIHHRFIVDKFAPPRAWGFDSLPVTGKVAEDFVIVSRVFQSETGEVLIAAAGITQYGTRAAGEFLTTPDYLEEIARQAPAGWQKQNLQIVFSVKIIDNTPGPPTILATHFW